MEIGQSALNAGREGWNRASEALTEASRQIASAAAVSAHQDGGGSAWQERQMPGELAGELIQLRVAEHQSRAACKVMATADEVVGTLLDIKA